MTTEVIWNEYSSQVRSFIRSQIHDEQTADDILQNVFLKIHSDVNQLHRIGNLKAWLYQMTKNLMIDHYRKNRSKSELDTDIPDEEASEPVLEQIASSIRFFINQLDEPMRQLMIRSELRGESQIEISKKMDLPYSTVKSRIQKGRELVKQMMLECCHYEFDRRGSVIDYECRQC